MDKILRIILIIQILIILGCGDNANKNDNNNKHNHSINNVSEENHHKTLAYFGDKENNLAVIVDVDNMKLIDIVATGHEKSYALEKIETIYNHQEKYKKMYIANRGSNAIDVFDTVHK